MLARDRELKYPRPAAISEVVNVRLNANTSKKRQQRAGFIRITSRMREEAHLVPGLATADRQPVVGESNRHRQAQALGVVQESCNFARNGFELLISRGLCGRQGNGLEGMVRGDLTKSLHQAVEVDDFVQLSIGESDQRRRFRLSLLLVRARRAIGFLEEPEASLILVAVLADVHQRVDHRQQEIVVVKVH